MSFGLAGRGRARVRRWESAGGRRILVVAPHPDDEVAGSGGTLLLHGRAGDQVTVLHVTDGRGSRALGLDPDTMARRRREEARASLEVLGVGRWEWLGLREGEWKEGELADRLEAVIAARSPDLIYAPSCVDFHPEHYRVARVLARVLARRALARPASVRVYQVQVPLTSALANLVTPVASVMAEVRCALDRFPTQRDSLLRCLRLRRYAAWYHGVPSAAEEFWELATDGYVQVHAEESRRPPHVTYRGLRRSALTDPLAFARGRSERRRLARLAAAGP